jgi:uncharacterized membrane protein YcaP (DUF421 family)
MDIDWGALFVPSGSLLEIVIRGTVVYLAIFLAMRFLPRRTIGALGPSDILVVVLIADAVQNGMAGEYRSITEGLLLVAVIFGWAFFIDWLDLKFPHWDLAEAPPRKIIANGRLLRKNMEGEGITEDEVMAQLRQHGQESPHSVVSAFIEGDGRFSVILRGHPPEKPAAQGKAT